MMSEHKSAVIVPVPDAERIVGEARRLYDPSARLGVPAHITLVHPFCPAPVPEETIRELEELFAATGPIALTFKSVGRFERTIYLEPSPAKPFVDMIEALIDRWPQWPPYGGAYASITPHLTIADGQADQSHLDGLAAMVVPYLPLASTITEAWLIETREDGFWHRRAVFSFGRSAAADSPGR
jgi:2'-5' RNA ligase